MFQDILVLLFEASGVEPTVRDAMVRNRQVGRRRSNTMASFNQRARIATWSTKKGRGIGQKFCLIEAACFDCDVTSLSYLSLQGADM
jgi:hypothetical protein